MEAGSPHSPISFISAARVHARGEDEVFLFKGRFIFLGGGGLGNRSQ